MNRRRTLSFLDMAAIKTTVGFEALPVDKERKPVTAADLKPGSLVELIDATSQLTKVEMVSDGVTEFQYWQEVDKP